MSSSLFSFPSNSQSSFEGHPLRNFFVKNKFFYDDEDSSNMFSSPSSSSYEVNSNFHTTLNASSKKFNINDLTPFRSTNVPTAMKVAANFDNNRRITLKLKEDGNGANVVASTTARTNQNAQEQQKQQKIPLKRKPEDDPINFQSFKLKQQGPQNNIKILNFAKMNQGKYVKTHTFYCFNEEDLKFPPNINKFLQKTCDDDDVETDDETLNYYVKKVRNQLVEACQAEKQLKLFLQAEHKKRMLLAQKENEKRENSIVIKEKPPVEFQQKSLKVVTNQ